MMFGVALSARMVCVRRRRAASVALGGGTVSRWVSGDGVPIRGAFGTAVTWLMLSTAYVPPGVPMVGT